MEGMGDMAEKIRPELLQFLQPGEVPLRILVVESLSYLPELRRMFPVAELSAVADEADRSMPELSLLKSMYTPEQRKELSRRLHRIEYGVDLPAQAQAFWQFYEEAGLFPDYTSAFIQSTVFHVERFYRQLMAVSGRQLDEIMALLQCGQAEALSEETAGRLQGLQHELEARLGKDGEDNA